MGYRENYLRMMGEIRRGELDPDTAKLARHWSYSSRPVFEYMGQKLLSAYREVALFKKRRKTRNLVDCMKISDRVLGGNMRKEHTAKNWRRVGNREWIRLQAHWDAVDVEDVMFR